MSPGIHPCCGRRGLIQSSYRTRDGIRVWRIWWAHRREEEAIPSEADFETGQAVTVTADGVLLGMNAQRRATP